MTRPRPTQMDVYALFVKDSYGNRPDNGHHWESLPTLSANVWVWECPNCGTRCETSSRGNPKFSASDMLSCTGHLVWCSYQKKAPNIRLVLNRDSAVLLELFGK